MINIRDINPEALVNGTKVYVDTEREDSFHYIIENLDDKGFFRLRYYNKQEYATDRYNYHFLKEELTRCFVILPTIKNWRDLI